MFVHYLFYLCFWAFVPAHAQLRGSKTWRTKLKSSDGSWGIIKGHTYKGQQLLSVRLSSQACGWPLIGWLRSVSRHSQLCDGFWASVLLMQVFFEYLKLKRVIQPYQGREESITSSIRRNILTLGVWERSGAVNGTPNLSQILPTTHIFLMFSICRIFTQKKPVAEKVQTFTHAVTSLLYSLAFHAFQCI